MIGARRRLGTGSLANRSSCALLALCCVCGLVLTGCVSGPGVASSGRQALPIQQSLAPRQVTLLLGGDLLFDLAPGRILAAEGPRAVLGGWAQLRDRPGIDLGLANLECPLTAGRTAITGKKYTFRGAPDLVPAALRELRFDAVSLANNHVLDFGAGGLLDTVEALDAAGVGFAGAGRDRAAAYAPLVLEAQGVRIGFLAFGGAEYVPQVRQAEWAAGDSRPGIAPSSPQADLLAAITAARAEVDLLVVSIHWGIEYATVTPNQRALGQAAIDAGADIVFGHHPHVVQPVEIHSGRPIIYSLGNLAFHAGQPQAREMAVAEVTATIELGNNGKTMINVVRLHGLANDGGRTILMERAAAQAFLGQIAKDCRRIGSPAVLEDRSLLIAIN